jgi:hypothetical protein
MSAIDPSFIRNIRDGLKNENIEANNLEALPEGLVGLYDKELFPPTLKWKERKETLQFFLVFALAQKEISADFAATILGNECFKVLANENETTEEKRLKKVNEFIQLHSKRFTSAGEGKFRLYHERFRVYILQKVSESDLAQFNQKFISLCESELKNNTEKAIPEKERYALEFLSTHFFISAVQGEKVCLNIKDADSLKNLAYDQHYWDRQSKASKGFEWSKKILNEMMSWASKFDEEEVIECALNKVDLYHQEQNDAPRIVQLVADGDIEIALQRIEAFGGDDKEGLQRKFILYMLCLMELTLLDSKDKEHLKGSIEKILKHFDEQIPANQPDLINWNDFFPSYLIFELSCELAELGLDYLIFYERTNVLENDWFEDKGPFNDIQFDVLISSLMSVDNYESLKKIAIEQSKLNQIERALFALQQALSSARKIWFKFNKITELTSISTEFAKLGKADQADAIIKESLEYTKEIQNEFDKNKAFEVISSELSKQGMMNKAVLTAHEISDESIRISAFEKISLELAKQAKFLKSLEIINSLDDSSKKDNLIDQITKEYFEIGNNIAVELAKSGKFQDAIKIAHGIKDDSLKCNLLKKISTELFKKEKSSFAYSVLQEAISCANSIGESASESQIKSKLLIEISVELAKQGRISESINLLEKINCYSWDKDNGFKEIILELVKQKNIKLAKSYLNKINNEFDRYSVKQEITRKPILTAKKILKLFPGDLNLLMRIEAISKQVSFENYKIDKSLEKLLFSSFSDISGEKQRNFINYIDNYLANFSNNEIIDKIKLIHLDFSENSQNLRMFFFKAILLKKWEIDKKKTIDLIPSLFFNGTNEISLINGISSLYSIPINQKTYLKILEKKRLSNEDYYYLGSNILNNVDLLIEILFHPKTKNNHFYLLLGFIDSYTKITNEDLLKIIHYTFQYPILLFKLLKKEKML